MRLNTSVSAAQYVNGNNFASQTTTGDSESSWCEWDLLWTDGAVQVDKLYKMKPYQRINHFPGMYALARKNHLASNLKKMQAMHPDDYKFFPETWLLPADYPSFQKLFSQQEGSATSAGKITFISKPRAAAQGKGIFLSQGLKDFDPAGQYVVQRYLDEPFLIDNLKFDLRIYVLLCGVDPLRVYFYKEGLCRLATCEYETPAAGNLTNKYMHLTNYAINKLASNYSKARGKDDDQGHKRTLTFAMKYLDSMGHDSSKVLHEIKSVIIKTLISVQPSLASTYRYC